MAMRDKNKATAWKKDGTRGRRLSKRLANVIERRQARHEERKAKEKEDNNKSGQPC